MKAINLILVTVLMATILASCTKSIPETSGTYTCKQHYNSDLVDKLTLELEPDGNVFLNSNLMNSTGSYEIRKDCLFVKTKLFDMKLKIKKDSLIGWNVLYVKSENR